MLERLVVSLCVVKKETKKIVVLVGGSEKWKTHKNLCSSTVSASTGGVEKKTGFHSFLLHKSLYAHNTFPQVDKFGGTCGKKAPVNAAVT